MRAIAFVVVVAAIAMVSGEVGVPGLTLTERDEADWTAFESFITKFGRSYNGLEEKLSRFGVFQSNLRRAEELTAMHNGEATFGVNQFTDMSTHEFRQFYTAGGKGGLNATLAAEQIAAGVKSGFIKPYKAPKPAKSHLLGGSGAAAYPQSVDWRSSKKVSPVRDQGECGCCFAFTAAAEMESQLLIKYNSPIILSPQQIVDCDSSNNGCSGGFYVSVWQYVFSNSGWMQDSQYPYQDQQGTCRFSASNKWNVKPGNGGSTTPGTTKEAIYQYLSTHGPAAAAIDASQLQHYTGGVMNYGQALCPSVDHAVTLVGYSSGSSTSANYYIVKNSWGSGWGENGFFRITTGSCMISSLVYGSTGF